MVPNTLHIEILKYLNTNIPQGLKYKYFLNAHVFKIQIGWKVFHFQDM